jgi:DNA-binding transcriptional LysR family regulator
MTRPLSLDALEVLDAIDRGGSFAAAANALDRVPSAVTYAVQKLEEDLGVSLFTREGRRSVLTPAGKLLLDQGRDLLAAADRLARATREVDRGWESRLDIAVDSVIDVTAFYPHLEAFYRIRPDVAINLFETVGAGSWEAAISGRADLVLGAPEPPGRVTGLSHELIRHVEWVLVVAPGHTLAGVDAPLAREQLHSQRCIVVRDSSSTPVTADRPGTACQPPLRVASVQQQIEAVLRGLGAGFLPRHRVGRQLQGGELVELPLLEAEPATPLHRVWKTGASGKALKWFLERLA